MGGRTLNFTHRIKIQYATVQRQYGTIRYVNMCRIIRITCHAVHRVVLDFCRRGYSTARTVKGVNTARYGTGHIIDTVREHAYTRIDTYRHG